MRSGTLPLEDEEHERNRFAGLVIGEKLAGRDEVPKKQARRSFVSIPPGENLFNLQLDGIYVEDLCRSTMINHLPQNQRFKLIRYGQNI